MSCAISDECALAVEVVLAKNTDEIGALTQWNEVIETLFQYKIAYKIILHPDFLFVHKENRGGLGLNAFNVHGNMSRIHRIGADASMLTSSTCFEIPKNKKQRSVQVDFNLELIKYADGFIAPPTGRERFLSVGSGHFVAGCRAINHGCRTPEARLKDETGKMNSARLWDKRPVLKQLCTVG